MGRGRIWISSGLTAALIVLVTASTAVAPARGATQHGAGHRRVDRSSPHRRDRTVNPLRARAMWIWELDRTDHGRVARIVAQAHAHRVTTLIIKSSDGVYPWSQFSGALVRRLHADHLRVCAWQYVYGDHPVTEARLGARAVRDGADCLVIDAESQYQGRYVAAQTYIRDLRASIGARYPVALAGFPYVDYHPGFPYSVFLGPGGAQYNVPQMYWGAIGVSPAVVFAQTYAFNQIYQRPIYPLGQLYGGVSARQIVRFRELSAAYHAGGVSWWDWQTAPARSWTAMSRRTSALRGFTPDTALASLGRGAVGDLVVWAQEHLVTAGFPVTIDGGFGRDTRWAVRDFQRAHALTADGIIGPDTWAVLLRYHPVAITWVGHGAGRYATSDLSSSGGGTVAAPGPVEPPIEEPVPWSAHLPGHSEFRGGAPVTG